MTSWSESLSIRYEDPGPLSDALVGVEQPFGNCETAIVRSLDRGSVRFERRSQQFP